MAWEPWDLSDDERRDRRILREDVSDALREALRAWLIEQFVGQGFGNSANHKLALAMQSSLRVDLGVKGDRYISTEELADNIIGKGDRALLWSVDWLLNVLGDVRPGQVQQAIASAAMHFDFTNSPVEVYVNDKGSHRLRRRLPEGVEEIAQEAADDSAKAGRLLSEAWRAAYALEPSPGEAMQLATRAVEAAAAPVVIPKSLRQRIGMIADTLSDQAGWELILWRDDSGFPDHQQMLVTMLRTLQKAQTDRHGDGAVPTPEEAQAHVQLASTLVAWFAAGAVRKRSS